MLGAFIRLTTGSMGNTIAPRLCVKMVAKPRRAISVLSSHSTGISFARIIDRNGFSMDIPCPSVPSPKSLGLRCVQNGPPARRSEPDWRLEGAYLKRYVTDEQRNRRPIFNATLRAAAAHCDRGQCDAKVAFYAVVSVWYSARFSLHPRFLSAPRSILQPVFSR